MSRSHRSSLSRLEKRKRPPLRVDNRVLTLCAFTGNPIGPAPEGKHMIVFDYGPDWAAELVKQQEILIASALKDI